MSLSTKDCDVDPFSCVFSIAATSGLLLPATEVQLLIDVLESLKKFVGKSFRNKDEFLLFNEGKSMEQLVELIRNEHEAVQIASLELLQAMMPVGWEVGVERMRRVPNTVNILIQILAPLDALPTVHEIGFFCLMRYLRNDAKSVSTFCEHGGVPLLLSFLKSDNFDVLGLVLQCLYWIMVASLSSRVETMDARIFVEQVVELCTSPIDEIQSVTCDIVLLLSELRKLRNKLRCVGVLEKICGIIVEGEVASNLQVRLLEIVANCLTDESANIQFAQGMGMFSWSLDVVAEKEPVARWDRTFALSLRLLAIFADSKENRRTLRDLEVETPSIKLMTTKSGHVKAAGLQLIVKLSEEEDCREAYGRLGAVGLVLDYLLDRKSVLPGARSTKSKSVSTKSTVKTKGTILKSTGVDVETVAPHETNFEIGTACLAALSAASRANSDVFFLPENLNRLVEFFKTKLAEVAEGSEVAARNAFDAVRNLFVDAEGVINLIEKSELLETTISYLETCRDRRLVVCGAFSCPAALATRSSAPENSFARPKLGDVSTAAIVSAVEVLTAFHNMKQMIPTPVKAESQGKVSTVSVRCSTEEEVDDSLLSPERLERRRRLHALIEDLLTSENLNVVVGGAKLAASMARIKCEGSALIRGELLALLWRRKNDLAEMLSRSENRILQTCLQRILDCDLSLKYSLLGRLDTFDVVSERFYDIGAKKGVEEALELLQKDFSDVKHNWREIVGIDKRQLRRLVTEAIPDAPPAPSSAESLQQASRGSLVLSAEASGEAIASAQGVNVMVTTDEEFVSPSFGSPVGRESMSQKSSAAPVQIVRYVEEDVDPMLRALIQHAKRKITPLPTLEDQIRCLGILVCFQFGGPMLVGDILPREVEKFVQNLRKENQSDRVHIGEIKCGAAYHRSLLFKALSDEVAIPCSLVRGDYFRCWNEVWMTTTTGWIYPTDMLRWILHHSVNSEKSQKQEIPILAAFDDLQRQVVTKDAPPDSMTVSLAMAMAIQNQFLKILLVDDKTAFELLGAVTRGDSHEIEETNGPHVERECDCVDHHIAPGIQDKCFCCPLCPGWQPSDLPYPSSTQTEADDSFDDGLGGSKSRIPKKFVVDLCFEAGTVISEMEETRIRNYTHF